MKNYIINNCLNLIKKYKTVDENELLIIKYGLEGIYLTITKTIVILAIAAIFKAFWETALFFITYGILRSFSFGIHAKKSWMCWLSSIIIFNFIPIIAIKYNLNHIIKIIIASFGTLLMFKNSPADTVKRPIVNKKRRMFYKLFSTFLCIIYTIIIIILNNQLISNCLMYSIVIQNILISPLTYKLFNLPYNNYLKYLDSHPKLNNL